MKTDELLNRIDLLLIEIDKHLLIYKNDFEAANDVRRVVLLLKDEVVYNLESINNRVLRAMHDIGMSSYKDFEDTPLERAIASVIDILYDIFPYYSDLKPLRGDFGKGEPI